MPVQVNENGLVQLMGSIDEPIKKSITYSEGLTWLLTRYYSIYPEGFKEIRFGDYNGFWPWPNYDPQAYEKKEFFAKILAGEYQYFKDVRLTGAISGSRLSGKGKDEEKDHRRDLVFDILRCLAADHCPICLDKLNWYLKQCRNFTHPKYKEAGFKQVWVSFEELKEGNGIQIDDMINVLGQSPSLDRLSKKHYDSLDTWIICLPCNELKNDKKLTDDVVRRVHNYMGDMIISGPDNDLILPEDLRLEIMVQIGHDKCK